MKNNFQKARTTVITEDDVILCAPDLLDEYKMMLSADKIEFIKILDEASALQWIGGNNISISGSKVRSNLSYKRNLGFTENEKELIDMAKDLTYKLTSMFGINFCAGISICTVKNFSYIKINIEKVYDV